MSHLFLSVPHQSMGLYFSYRFVRVEEYFYSQSFICFMSLMSSLAPCLSFKFVYDALLTFMEEENLSVCCFLTAHVF